MIKSSLRRWAGRDTPREDQSVNTCRHRIKEFEKSSGNLTLTESFIMSAVASNQKASSHWIIIKFCKLYGVNRLTPTPLFSFQTFRRATMADVSRPKTNQGGEPKPARASCVEPSSSSHQIEVEPLDPKLKARDRVLPLALLLLRISHSSRDTSQEWGAASGRSRCVSSDCDNPERSGCLWLDRP